MVYDLGIHNALLENSKQRIIKFWENRVISFIQSILRWLIHSWVRTAGVSVATLLAVFFSAVMPAHASDHQDTTFLATRLTSADLTDLYVFESPKDPSKVVLAMDFDPLITPGERRPFDPAILYQFKIDNTGDGIEDRVIQFQIEDRGDDPEKIGRAHV